MVRSRPLIDDSARLPFHYFQEQRIQYVGKAISYADFVGHNTRTRSASRTKSKSLKVMLLKPQQSERVDAMLDYIVISVHHFTNKQLLTHSQNSGIFELLNHGDLLAVRLTILSGAPGDSTLGSESPRVLETYTVSLSYADKRQVGIQMKRLGQKGSGEVASTWSNLLAFVHDLQGFCNDSPLLPGELYKSNLTKSSLTSRFVDKRSMRLELVPLSEPRTRPCPQGFQEVDDPQILWPVDGAWTNSSHDCPGIETGYQR